MSTHVRAALILPFVFVQLHFITTSLFAGAPYHHVHLTSTDPFAGANWYHEHLGGELFQRRDAQNRKTSGVRYGEVIVIFFLKQAGFPGSEGSSVDHLGFSVPDLAAKIESFKAAGVQILSEIRDVKELYKSAMVSDPWGTKVEVVEDPDNLGFRHISLKGPEPEKIFD